MAERNFTLLFTRRLEELGVRYMVTGSVAAMIYGLPRTTRDVDVVVILTREQCDRLPEAFPPSEFYCPPREAIRQEAARDVRGQFNILHLGTTFRADIYVSGRDPLDVWGFAKTRRAEVEEEFITIAPPEYVIVRKLEFFREGGSEKHIRDIAAMLDVSSSSIEKGELEQMINQRGLGEVWTKVLEDMERKR